jgi:signal transduction histidine kinase
LVIVFIVAVVYGLYATRERHRRQLVDVRRRIARDLHDEVGSQVAGIKLMADLARDESLSPEARRAEIDEISHTSKDLVDALKEVSWFIQSDDDTINHLVDRMRTYAARHLRGMQLVFQADDDEIAPYLPERGRREFILIFREAVRNCAQHSGASTVSIDLRLEPEDATLVLEIEDDGVGFEVNERQNGLGLRSMVDRAEILKGRLDIESTPGVGTKLILSIPVENTV